jgi:lysophospholipase L1-like esterase
VRRRRFDGAGYLYDSHGQYPDIVRAVARSTGVPLVDMHVLSARVLNEFGADSSAKLFLQLRPGEHPNYPQGIDDNTHFSPRGAAAMARMFAAHVSRESRDFARLLRQ